MHIKFDMDLEEIQNLCLIIQRFINEHRFTRQLEDYSVAEKEWFKSHANYVEKEILQKIVKATQFE